MKYLILLILLSSCASKSAPTLIKINLPNMPLAGDGVAIELTNLCVDESKCTAINDYLNRLYAFKVKYEVYKRELKQ